MLASLPVLRARHALLGAAASLCVLSIAPASSAADAPPDLPPLTAPAARAQQPAPPPRPAPPTGYPVPAPPWTSPAEVPPGYPAGGYGQPYPGYYPMPYAQPQQESYQLPSRPPRRYQSAAMFAGGVVMVGAGLVGVIVGAALVSTATNRIDIYCDSPSFPCAHKDDAARKGGGVALMALGGIVGAAGIPLWIVGSKMVLVRRDELRPALVPELRVGAGSARVTVSF